MKYLIVGASAGLGRRLAERLAAQGQDIFLVASDERDLAPLASDLALRCRVTVGHMAADLQTLDAADLRQRVIDFFRAPPAGLLFVAGVGHRADSGYLDAEALNRLIDVNFRSGVAIVNAFLPDMIERRTTLCVGIGSVAAIRGRGANIVYGAAKRGLEFYFEAVRHRVHSAGCRVQFYRVGFMRTTMLENRRTLVPAVTPEVVARQIIRNLGRGSGVRYAPRWWAAVALLLALLPPALFRKLMASK